MKTKTKLTVRIKPKATNAPAPIKAEAPNPVDPKPIISPRPTRVLTPEQIKDRKHLSELHDKYYGSKHQGSSVAKDNAAILNSHTAKILNRNVKITVTQHWIEVMELSAQTPSQDITMALEMRRRCPDKIKYTETHVATVRNLYNKGKLVGQKGVPKIQLKKYVPDIIKNPKPNKPPTKHR
jgi:hypothetical protein